MKREDKIAKIKEGKYFAIGDLAVFGVCILLIAAFTIAAFSAEKRPGKTFEVISFGKTIATLPLEEDAEYLYTVHGGEGSLVRVMLDEYYGAFENGNLIRVADGKVYVAEADCPDHTCMLMGRIDSGEILCMPHGLTIKVTGGLEDDI